MNKFDKREVVKAFKRKDNAKKKLEKDCLKLWADIVKMRANYRCEFPGCRRSQDNGHKMDAHHYFTRGAYTRLKYDIENGICLCVSHHRFGPNSAHQGNNFRSKLFDDTAVLKNRFNDTWEHLLELRALVKVKVDMFMLKLFLEQEYERYKEKLKQHPQSLDS